LCSNFSISAVYPIAE